MLSDESDGDGLQEVDTVRNQSISGIRFVIKIHDSGSQGQQEAAIICSYMKQKIA